jgi:undecaprenyl-diphosphatase
MIEAMQSTPPVQLPEAAASSVDEGAPSLFDAIVLGVVEGLTEFLPISSTGHLIVTNRLLGDPDGDPTFEVVVQIGAISAIAWLYRQRLATAIRTLFTPTENATDGRVNLLWTLLVAALPAIVLGLAFDDVIESLLFSPETVATTMVVGGFALVFVERLMKRRANGSSPVDGDPSGCDPDDVRSIGLRAAFVIGVFQCFALIPGTSRSGATIVGALLLGFGRKASAEFSFLVGLPILYGAGLYKTLGDSERVFGELLPALVVGIIASFLTALAIVGPFVRYLQGHTFAVFAWYRIVVGLGLAAATLYGLLG